MCFEDYYGSQGPRSRCRQSSSRSRHRFEIVRHTEGSSSIPTPGPLPIPTIEQLGYAALAGTFDDDPPYTQFSVISHPIPNALGDIARLGVHTGGHPTPGELIVDYISLRPDPRLGHARPHASDILLGYWYRTAMRHPADLQSVKITAVAETTFLGIMPMVLEAMGHDPRRRGADGPLRIERWHTGPYAMIENSTFGKMARYML